MRICCKTTCSVSFQIIVETIPPVSARTKTEVSPCSVWARVLLSEKTKRAMPALLPRARNSAGSSFAKEKGPGSLHGLLKLLAFDGADYGDEHNCDGERSDLATACISTITDVMEDQKNAKRDECTSAYRR